MATIVGGCLCKCVQYEFDGEIGEVSMCHGSMCRKAQGSACVAVGVIDATKVRIVQGQDRRNSDPSRKRRGCSVLDPAFAL